MNDNKLTSAETERIAILLEECGEVQQVLGKILRHGWRATKDGIVYDNRKDLEEELGNVNNAIQFMIDASDISETNVALSKQHKASSIYKFLHHQ